MKKILLLFALILGNSIVGQTQSGEIIYKVVKNENYQPQDRGIGFNNFREELNSIAENIRFRLVFNGQKSKFVLDKNLTIDREDFKTRTAIFILRGKSEFFTDLSGMYLIEQKEFAGDLFKIQSSFKDLNWNLVNESKKIGQYSCYKATSYRLSTSKDGTRKKVPIVVWYAPEISTRFGPFEAVGLPGLVLEYNLAQFRFVAENIVFGEIKTSEDELAATKKGTLITVEDFNNYVKRLSKEKLQD